MRVVDFSGSGSNQVAVDVVASPVTDLLLSPVLVLDVDGEWEYDLDATTLAAMREAAGDDLPAMLRDLAGDGHKFMLNLLPTILTAPDATDLDGYLDHFADFDPAELWSIILSNHTHGWLDVTEDTVRRAADGDEVAIRTLHSACEDDASTPAFVDVVLDTAPADLHAGLLEVLRALRDRVWPVIADEALPAMQRDADARGPRVEETDLQTLVLETTNGLEWTPGPGTRRLLLLPSFVFRPWITVTGWGETTVISYPVADAHVIAPSSAPPPHLVKLLKALGDEGRLRLLQRMTTGAISLTEAAEEMDVSKPTAHHHLATLRQAGLVTIAESGRSKTYTLRGNPPAQVGEALARYLGGARSDDDAVA